MHNPQLKIAEAHSLACWQKLEEHAKSGRCNCHVSADGDVHILHGCPLGRSLHEEYWIAAERVREISGQTVMSLEDGDFDGRDPEPTPCSPT